MGEDQEQMSSSDDFLSFPTVEVGLNTFRSQSQSETPPFSLDPKPIEGFVAYINRESWGGNAGDNRVGANAVYQEEEGEGKLIFTNDPKEQGLGNINVNLIATMSPYVSELIRKKMQPYPPELIEKILVKDELTQEQRAKILEMVLNHNTHWIVKYLKEGGDPAYLPQTPLKPEEEELQKFLQT